VPRRLILLSALIAVVGACTETELEVQRDTLADTIIVRTISEGVWGGEARLEEDLSIGTVDGADEYIFGDVTEIAPDRRGGLFIFDRQVPALRHYDIEGRFIATLGAEGSGPGEYGDAILGLIVRRDGKLLAYDARNGRINVYEPDGTPSEHWPVSGGLFMGRQLLTDSADHVYVKILTGQPQWPMPRPWPIGLLHLGEHGQVLDTIQPPSIEGEPVSSLGPLDSQKVWAMHPLLTVVGVNDTYAFEMRMPSGEVIRVLRDRSPLPVTDKEWRAYEARREWEIKKEGRDLPRTPRTKPAYRAFRIAEDGRVWVRKYMPVTYQDVESVAGPNKPPLPFTEPVGFDVFDSDGTYLGAIIVPDRTKLHWIGSDHVYGVRRGELDEQYVVRLRLRTAGG